MLWHDLLARAISTTESLRRYRPEGQSIAEVASQDPPAWNQIAEFLKAMQRLRDSAGFAA